METELVKNGLDFSRRKQKWIVLLGLIGFSSYGLYRVYHIPSVARKRKRIMNILGSLVSLAEMVSDSAETITVVSRDLKAFLKSDSNEIPNSLRQLSKIARSEEFMESAIRVSQAMTVGILRGYKEENGLNEIQEINKTSVPDRVMDKLMSSAGTGFISVIVGSFARNLVLGFYINGGSDERLSQNAPLGASYVSSSSSTLARWVDVVSDDRCKVLLADCIKTFVSTAVAVYLDKTMNVNFYDEMFSGLTNPKHQSNVKDILVSLCNGVVETLVKTSHQVLTGSNSCPSAGSISSHSIINHNEASSLKNKKGFELEACLGKVKERGLVTCVSSTLAVPSTRKFVLDVTGRVTFETVRSLVEFFFCRVLDGLKRSLNVVRDEVLERGFEVVRYVGSKSSIVLTICLMLFLHLVGSTQVLLPA